MKNAKNKFTVPIDFNKLIEDVETLQTSVSDEASVQANTPVGIQEPTELEGEPEGEGAEALSLLQRIAGLLGELVDLSKGDEIPDSGELDVPSDQGLPEEPPANTEEFSKIRHEN